MREMGISSLMQRFTKRFPPNTVHDTAAMNVEELDAPDHRPEALLLQAPRKLDSAAATQRIERTWNAPRARELDTTRCLPSTERLKLGTRSKTKPVLRKMLQASRLDLNKKLEIRILDPTDLYSTNHRPERQVCESLIPGSKMQTLKSN